MAVQEQAATGVYLIAVCPTCSATRYRSTKPISDPKECVPANFRGVDGAPEPQGEIPLCYVCNSVLTFAKEASLQRRPEPVTTTSEAARVNSFYPAHAGNETLFEAQDGEVITNIFPSGDAVVVLTNRRVVRVRFV